MMQRSLYDYYYFLFNASLQTLEVWHAPPYLTSPSWQNYDTDKTTNGRQNRRACPCCSDTCSQFLSVFLSRGGEVENIAGRPPPDHRFLLLPTLSVTGRCGGFFYLHRLFLRPRVCASLRVCAYVPADGPLTIRPSLG